MTGLGGGWGAEGWTVDQGRRCRIRKWCSFSRTMGLREGVGMCRTGSRGGRFDSLVGLVIQIYTTIS